MSKDYFTGEQLDQLGNSLIDGQISDVPQMLARLTDNQLNQVYYNMLYRKGAIARRLEQIKDARTDRRNDFDAMVKQANKRFDELDIAILQMLDYEVCYYTRGVVSQLLENDQQLLDAYATDGITGDAARFNAVSKRIKKLKRRGLVELVRGLVDESDGMLAGSGWQLCYRNRQTIDRLLAVFEAAQNQEKLDV